MIFCFRYRLAKYIIYRYIFLLNTLFVHILDYRQQLDSLDLLQQEHKLVEIQYREKEEACRELSNTLKFKSAQCQDLENR